MRSTTLGLLLFAALPFAAAHGIVRAITIDGKTYKGNTPGNDAFDSPIRLVSSASPVKGATNRAINCGQSAKKAALVADANPGSTLEFAWGGADGSNWPHNTGPVLTYLASCGDTTCDQFDAINAQWFKFDETGKKTGSSEWFQQDIMDGKTYSTTLPNNLAAGQYLVRHEIIGLHLADAQGGAEFYPSCTQINVGGDGTGTPSSSELVSFPGAYSDSDPGILVNAFDSDAYNFPGPEIAALAGGNSDGSSSGGSGSSSGLTKTASGSSGSSSRPTRTSADISSTRTRAVAIVQTSTADDSSPSSAAASTTTRRRRPCGGALTSETTSPSQSPVSSGEESVITSFAVTSTIKLRSIPTDAASHPFGLSDNTPDVRPHRVSRVMRNLLKPR